MRIFACLLSLVGCSIPSLQAEEPPPTLETITQSLLDWQNSLQSVSLTYLMLNDPHSELMRQSNMEGVQITSYSTFCWDDLGRKFHHAVVYYDGMTNMRSLRAADSVRFFQAVYLTGNSERGRPIVVEVLGPKDFPPGPIWYKGTNEVFFLGLWYSLQEMWLGEMLQARQGKILGQETVNGVKCVAVGVEPIPNGTEHPGYETIVYLHPEYHYLPWRIGDVKKEPVAQLTRYQEVAPGLFFPAEGEYLGLSHSFWKLEEFAVNQPLDDALFELPLGPGTKVQNENSSEVWIHGTEAEHQELLDQLGGAGLIVPLKPLSTRPAPVPPEPEGPNLQAWLFVGAVGGLMLAIFVAMLRSRRSS